MRWRPSVRNDITQVLCSDLAGKTVVLLRNVWKIRTTVMTKVEVELAIRNGDEGKRKEIVVAEKEMQLTCS